MKRTSWQEKLIGSPLPPSLSSIKWQKVGDGNQEVGWDEMKNEWRREKNTRSYLDEKSEEPKLIIENMPGFTLWTTLQSRYREAVHLPVFVTVNQEGMTEYIEIQANVSYGPCHGRPGNIDVQRREENQVGRLMKALSQRK